MNVLLRDNYLLYLDILEGAKFSTFFSKDGQIFRVKRNLQQDADSENVTYIEQAFAHIVASFFINKTNDAFLAVLNVLFQAEVNFFFNLYFSNRLRRMDAVNIQKIMGHDVQIKAIPEFLAIRFTNVMCMTKAEQASIGASTRRDFEAFVCYALSVTKIESEKLLIFTERVRKLFFTAAKNYAEWAGIDQTHLSRKEIEKKFQRAKETYKYMSSVSLC